MNNNTPSARRMRILLTKARKQKGLTQVGLSKKLGKYKNYVWKYENREHNIKLVEFLEIAPVLGIDTQRAVRDIGPDSYNPEQSSPLLREYATTPLTQKLGIRPHMRVFVIDAPAHYSTLLDPLPEGVKLVTRITKSTDLIHAFVTQKSKLSELLQSLRGQLGADTVLWISWPKRSAGQTTDVSADVVQELALPFDLTETDLCTVDSTWSGLKLTLDKKTR